MFNDLWSVAKFDKNLLNVFVLKEIHKDSKNRTDLHSRSKYSKSVFLDTYRQMDKFIKNGQLGSLVYKKPILPILENLAKQDKALPVIFLYILENKDRHIFSTYGMAQECSISHNRIHTLMDMLVKSNLIIINKCARSFFDIDMLWSIPIEKSSIPIEKDTIPVEKDTIINIDSILNIDDLFDNLEIDDIETKSQIAELKGLTENLYKNESIVDSNSLHYLIKYINNIYIKLIKYINNIKVFKRTSEQNELSDPDWSQSILQKTKKFFSTPIKTENDKVIIQQDNKMKENVLYICNSWNEFASKDNRRVKKFRIPKSYVTKGILPDSDNLLKSISEWIQSNSDDWKETWDELIEYSETNKFMKGLYKNGSWKPSLSWVFTVHPERGLNLDKVLNVGYDFANETPKIGEMKELQEKRVGTEPVYDFPNLEKIIAQNKKKELEKIGYITQKKSVKFEPVYDFPDLTKYLKKA